MPQSGRIRLWINQPTNQPTSQPKVLVLKGSTYISTCNHRTPKLLSPSSQDASVFFGDRTASKMSHSPNKPLEGRAKLYGIEMTDSQIFSTLIEAVSVKTDRKLHPTNLWDLQSVNAAPQGRCARRSNRRYNRPWLAPHSRLHTDSNLTWCAGCALPRFLYNSSCLNIRYFIYVLFAFNRAFNPLSVLSIILALELNISCL